MKPDTHLLLVSAQPVPNLTPLLDDAVKPRRVILLVSPDMRQRADWLEAIIKIKGIKTERWSINDAWDIEHIRDRVLELISHYQDDSIALNATGGTKPMSIAAYEVFRAFDKPIFYVHPDHDRLIWMHPNNQPAHELADRIKLKEFLRGYGATVTRQGSRQGVKPELRELTQTLIDNIQAWAKPLSVLNYYAAKAEPSLGVTLDGKHQNYHELFELIEHFADGGLLEFNGHRLRFPDEAARFHVNGGWLEEHVYGLCLNLKKRLALQDIARGLEVERGYLNPPVKNELDIAFLKNNRLYLIECKTHSGKSGDGGKNADALYKLDSLKDLVGGLQAKAMLVSYAGLNAHDRQRARDLALAVCDSQDLASLPAKLTAWINP